MRLASRLDVACAVVLTKDGLRPVETKRRETKQERGMQEALFRLTPVGCSVVSVEVVERCNSPEQLRRSSRGGRNGGSRFEDRCFQ